MFAALGSSTFAGLWPPEPPYDESGLVEPFARPSAKLTTSRITPQHLADFQRDPLLLRRQQFLYHGLVVGGDGGGAETSRPQNGLLCKVTGLLATEQGNFAIILFEGSRYPVQQPVEVVLKLLSASEVVVEEEE
jgi:hypothetical protein